MNSAAKTPYEIRQALRDSHPNTAAVTYWRGTNETVAEWIAERTAVKARHAATERKVAADWVFINALIARAAAEDAEYAALQAAEVFGAD